MTHSRWSVLGGVAGLLIATIVVTFSGDYRSTGILRIRPSAIGERYVPAAPFHREPGLDKVTESQFSRASLVNMIQTHGLYPHSLKRQPMEEVMQKMKSDIEIETTNGTVYQVAFTYPNPFLAQKVLADLMGRMIHEHRRMREEESAVFIHFLTGRAEEAANEWAEAVRKAHAGGERDARLQMEIDFARDHYRTVSDRLAEARAAKAMDGMQLGPGIEIVDMASLPASKEGSRAMILFGGLAGGISTGLLLSFLIALFRAGRQPRELSA